MNLSTICAAAALAAQPAPLDRPADVQAHAPVARQQALDLKARFEPRRLRKGRNIVYDDGKLRMVATVRRGRIVSVEARNISGQRMRLNNQQGSPVGGRPCIFCYNLDQPLASTCIEVPCGLLPILKWVNVSR